MLYHVYIYINIFVVLLIPTREELEYNNNIIVPGSISTIVVLI